MKTIIFPINEKTLNIDSVKETDIVCIQYKQNNIKLMLVNTPEGVIGCKLGEDDLTNQWVRNNKKQYLKDYKNMYPTMESFVFKSKGEMLLWFMSND